MPRQKLATIQGVKPEIKVEGDEKAVGQTPDGKIIWEVRRPRWKKVPLLDPTTGQQRYRKHLRTGEPMNPLFTRVEDGETVERYIKIANTMGNISKLHNFEEKAGDKERKQRRARVQDMQERLAQVLVDEGLTPEELVARLKAQPKAPEYPKDLGNGKYLLSSGDEIEASNAEEAAAYEETVAA